MIKMKKGLTLGIIFVVFAIVAIYLTNTQISLGLYDPDGNNTSPRDFPMFASVLMGIFGVMNIIRSTVFKKDEYVTINLKAEGKILLCFISMIVYLLVFKWIGFIIATSLLGSFILLLQGSKNWKYYLIVVITTIIVFVGFKYGLSVTKLPWGYPLIYIFG